jgi:hypothetical protein
MHVIIRIRVWTAHRNPSWNKERREDATRSNLTTMARSGSFWVQRPACVSAKDKVTDRVADENGKEDEAVEIHAEQHAGCECLAQR